MNPRRSYADIPGFRSSVRTHLFGWDAGVEVPSDRLCGQVEAGDAHRVDDLSSPIVHQVAGIINPEPWIWKV